MLLSSIIQTMSIGEGLFPPSINTFVYHQLVHLVPATAHFGPPRQIWEFKQEQMVQQISRARSQKGGVSIEQTAIKFYMSKELRKTDFYNEQPYNVEEAFYDIGAVALERQVDERILLQKDQVQSMLRYFVSMEGLSASTKKELQSIKQIVDKKSPQQLATTLGERYCWLEYTSNVFLKARSKIAGDIYLTGRGTSFHSLKRTNLKKKWQRAEEISCWARLRSLSLINPEKKDLKGAEKRFTCKLAQINCFFRLECPPLLWGNENDAKIINETVFVLGNSQPATFAPRTNTIELVIDEERNVNNIIVPIADVIMQHLVVLGLDNQRKPIYLGEDRDVSSKGTYVCSESALVQTLVFFQLGKLTY